MRWGTLWLTAVMIAATSAAYSSGVITVENIPIPLDQSTPNNGMKGENNDEQSAGTTGKGEGSLEIITLGPETCYEDESDCVNPPVERGSTSDGSVNEENSDTITEGLSGVRGGDTPTTTTEQTTQAGVALNEELIVTTNSGKVQGFLWQGKDDIISYIDIPYGTFYAKPLEAATAAEPWETHSVRDHDKRCPQIQDNEYVGNKDCLTLSIFKPIIAEKASVLFYIHGDDFKTGSGDPSIYGPNYLVTNGIILVLPNYRLGPLGFLCMQNETAPGNMALKDLNLALSWIHDNIHFFGGNPDNIVVSGDGRSGALAELLALSPKSKDHVSKVISESGSLLSHWVLDRDPKSKVADLFDRIQEAEKSIKSRMDFSLEDLDLSTIVKAGNEIEFKPCLEAEDDDAFMTETPYAMITTEKIETTFLMGSAMYAGLHEALHHTEDSIKELNEDFTLLLPNDLTFPTLTLKAEIGGRVKRQYFGEQNITLDNVRNISLYFTDVRYLSPGIRSARLLAEAGAKVYFYVFSFVGKFNRESESLNSPVDGAVRGDIVGYLFTQDGRVPGVEDTDETKMVVTLTEMWTNFLTEGHPATENIKWNKLESENHDEEEWLLIDSAKPSMQKGLHVDRLPLWTDIYEEHFIEVAPNEELVVTTNSGKVQGFLWQGKDDIISYIDIPYGTFYTKPLEAATAAEPWEMHSVRDHDKRCPQIQDNGYVGNKDCLTLSIFKPIIAEKASVLFYIHGDDFKTGSGDPSIYGPNYLVTNGIILVLPNYRLGPLGFLCMQNETAPGNMALKDLNLALSWIHDNIHFFGGNPDNIVVSGDGRSGALAELLALSPKSKDHVSKVISESGSLLSHWVLDRDPKSKVADLFDRIQEAEKSIKSRIDFSLEDLDLSAIVKAGNEIEFKPCLEAEDDDAFMTETPYAMITTEKIETTFLMGSAMYAGLHEALHHTEDSIKELNEDFTLLLPNDLTFPTLTLKTEIGGRVKKQYFGEENITLDNVRNISLYFTDVGYLSPGIRSARLLAKAGATVYFYEFSFVGKFNRESESLNSPVDGAVRGDIVGYLFTQDGRVPDVEDTDETKMVVTLTEMWTNFLTEGHPATETTKWNKLESENHDEEEWLLIDSDKPSMQKGLHVDRLPLWTDIYEEHFIEEAPNEELVVTTNSGKVQGFLWQGKDDIISYIDIPYGTFYTKPLKAATAAEPWEMHSVRHHDKRCPQIQDSGYVGDKDCLTLSIFKPIIAENASVLFYIHGDDFKTGSGDPSIYGPNYLVTNGIILVLPNYRLGPLGFLCMQNETAPGNMALKDLNLALSWIHDNIHFFGGNPDNIVVSGDGRSGALAELLALSPMSKDHVSKVISESGSLLSHRVLDRDPKSKVADFFDRIQETEKSIESRIDFSLEDLDFSAIMKAGNEIEFKPCLEAEDDDAFMTETPYAMITETTKKIETTFLMGSAMYAGLHEALHHTNDSIKELNEDFTLLLPNDLTFPTLSLKAEIGGRVKRQYFGEQNITLDNVRNISLYFTDVGYLSPGIRSARLLAEAGATVYFYEFSFLGKFNRESESLNSSMDGAVRGDIVGYLFTQDGRVPDVEDTDETKMVVTLTEMWTNFLTEGQPATETIKWNNLENVNHDEEEWLLIDSDKPSMQKGLYVDRLRLWTNIYEEHFIDGNHARGLSPSVLTVLIFQLVFWLVFCRNVSHVF